MWRAWWAELRDDEDEEYLKNRIELESYMKSYTKSKSLEKPRKKE